MTECPATGWPRFNWPNSPVRRAWRRNPSSTWRSSPPASAGATTLASRPDASIGAAEGRGGQGRRHAARVAAEGGVDEAGRQARGRRAIADEQGPAGAGTGAPRIALPPTATACAIAWFDTMRSQARFGDGAGGRSRRWKNLRYAKSAPTARFIPASWFPRSVRPRPRNVAICLPPAKKNLLPLMESDHGGPIPAKGGTR